MAKKIIIRSFEDNRVVTKAATVQLVNRVKLVVKTPFKDIFKIKPDNLEAIKDSIKTYGFNPNRPIEVLKEKDGEYVIIDGHTRFAAVNAILEDTTLTNYSLSQGYEDNEMGLTLLPILVLDADEEEAVKYILRNGFDRRNIDDSDIIEVVRYVLDNIYAKKYGMGSKNDFVKSLLPGLSSTKANNTCVVLERASDDQIAQVRAGIASINSMYQKVREHRPEKINVEYSDQENTGEKRVLEEDDNYLDEEDIAEAEDAISREEEEKVDGEGEEDEEKGYEPTVSREEQKVRDEWASEEGKPPYKEKPISRKETAVDRAIQAEMEEEVDWDAEFEKQKQADEEELAKMRNPYPMGEMPLEGYSDTVFPLKDGKHMVIDGKSIYILLDENSSSEDAKFVIYRLERQIPKEYHLDVIATLVKRFDEKDDGQ